MIEGIPRISVRIITYKQEELIKRAIVSLLAQRDYIYEICISDDCSPDRTWEVLQQFDKEYPGLFKLNRNEQNLGLFLNVEKTWAMATGDVVYGLAGDDEVGEGWFKSVVEFIIGNNIDYKNELFCIYGDYLNKYPNGDTYRFSNRLVLSGISPLKLSLRGLIGNRGCCYSINVLRKYHSVSQGRSHIAEDAIDRQLQLWSEKSYYIKKVGNIYYANIGVCTQIDDEILKERERIRPYALKFLEENGAQLDKYDKRYSLKFFNAFHWSNHHPSLKNRLKAFYLYIISYDPQIGIKGINLRRFVFSVLKRLPHNKPIHW
jgi:glycosyltransferase involved in cell wall biosynthesis